MAYSILIKNGVVIDGTGKEPYRADVGISANRIDAVGNLGNAAADQIIDATNLYVTPGFIDLTTHSDVYGTLFSVPSQESLLRQGITTILVGNCGESLAPVAKKESLIDLERWTTGFSIPINWSSVAEYYKNIENLGVGLNVATLIGQETIKRNAASEAERLFLFERAMQDGAWGLSSNFTFAELDGGSEREILNLLKIVKKYNGLYKIHLRDEGKDFLPSVASAIALSRQIGVRTVISHLKAIGRGAWGDFKKALRMLKSARENNVDIAFDVSPYLRTGSMLVSLLPSWARVGTNLEILERLRDPAASKKIVEDLRAATLHSDKILIASASNNKTAVGQTLSELASRANFSPEELMLELLRVNNLGISIFGKTVSGRNLLHAVREPYGVIASDGAGYDIDFQRFWDLAHPRSFGTYPRFLNLIAPRAKITLGEAVAKITSRPASLLGLKNRGVLKSDFIADLAIFHPEEFKDRSTYKNPYNYASGLHFLIISGKLAIADDVLKLSKIGAVLNKTNFA